MPYSLSSAGSCLSLQKSKNLGDQSLWYLTHSHTFLRQVQCIKSITSFFPALIQYSLDYKTIVLNTAFSMVEKYLSWILPHTMISIFSPLLDHKKIRNTPKYHHRLQKVPLLCRENDTFFCTRALQH